ncbi:MAG TPA: site-2 protease family protein [Bryobacteraceae bacterium]|jgi:Zn-dependent protease|nr:site-2 protease family protein [Bryobacteraceae bacterium]
MEAALINVLMFWMLTTPHEFAHAWVAMRLGDDTPVVEGRVTLNPLAHVDWLGTVILPLIMSISGAGFIGWGKSVNTNPQKLRWGLNGMALVAMAGPASNVVFAILLLFIAAHSGDSMRALCATAARLSLFLAIFNMLPVPPLDGSKLLLAARVPFFIYLELARFGFLLILLAISATSLGGMMSRWSLQATQLIYRLFA